MVGVSSSTCVSADERKIGGPSIEAALTLHKSNLHRAVRWVRRTLHRKLTVKSPGKSTCRDLQRRDAKSREQHTEDKEHHDCIHDRASSCKDRDNESDFVNPRCRFPHAYCRQAIAYAENRRQVR